MGQIAAELRVADEVWIVIALLHRERPSADDFSIEEIMQRAKEEQVHAALRPGLYVHVVQHCVANREPNPGRYRILYETSEGRRRLFRAGDSYHHAREGSKTAPRAEDIPEAYRDLLAWYQGWSEETRKRLVEDDPLLKAMGSGKELWANEHADEYVRKMREGWE